MDRMMLANYKIFSMVLFESKNPINITNISILIVIIPKNRFVLCPECDNPETELLISTKRSTISQGCKACGYHGLIESNHKLVTFILKNPPTLNPAVQGSSLTEGKRSKRSKRTNGDTNGDVSQDDANESLDGSTLNDNSDIIVSFLIVTFLP